jgi:hypothetical protein
MNGMLVWQSALVGLQVLSGGAILVDLLPESWVGLFILTVSAAQASTTFYIHGQGKPAEMPMEARNDRPGIHV